MSASITQGSSEFMIIDLVDVLGNVTDLSSDNVKYSVYQSEGNTPMVVDEDATNVIAMRVYALVNTSAGSGLSGPSIVPVTGWWQTGEYNLYLKFSTGSEAPRVGPFSFLVVS